MTQNPSVHQLTPFRENLMVLSICCVTMFGSMTSGIMTTALPTIGKDLDISTQNLQWPTSVLSLTNGTFLLLFGRLSDLYGRKMFFLLGTLFFCIITFVTGFSPNEYALNVFMALMGIAQAANTPAAVGILGAYFPPGPKKNRAFAALGAGNPIGFIFGLIFGGGLASIPSKWGWRSAFFILAGLSTLVLVAAYFNLAPDPPRDATRDKRVDWIGSALSCIGLCLFTFSLADSQNAGWKTAFIPTVFAVSIIFIASFIFWEWYSETRGWPIIMSMKIWRVKGFSELAVMIFFSWWPFQSLAFFSTLFYQEVQLLSPIQTAVRFLPMVIMGTALNVITGYLLGRIHGLYLILWGQLFSLGAALLFANIIVTASYWEFMLFVMSGVVGPDLYYSLASIRFSASVPKSQQALAGGIFNVITRLASSIGLSVSNTIAAEVTRKFATQRIIGVESPAALEAGYRAVGWLCVGCTGLAILIAIVFMRDIGVVGRKTEELPEQEDNTIATDEVVQLEKLMFAGVEGGATTGIIVEEAVMENDGKLHGKKLVVGEEQKADEDDKGGFKEKSGDI